mmetsp:Transcript_10773/g.16013  ORF Transcript_10773/g.16013 Transcript_10773/m.16013 type:complete len:243 (+) Transcript_10773:84-812(+)
MSIRIFQLMGTCVFLLSPGFLQWGVDALVGGLKSNSARVHRSRSILLQQKQRCATEKFDGRSAQRREFLSSVCIAGGVMISFVPYAFAAGKTGSIKTSQFSGKGAAAVKTTNDPKEAFANLIRAREELLNAKKMLATRKSGDDDFTDKFKDLINDSVNINNFEGNALALLSSKAISDETKKEIGTIRRYGVGADVQIMFGGLVSELDASEYPDLGEVSKYLQRTLDSLQEVITLCENDGMSI